MPSVTWIASCYPKGIEFFKWLAKHGWDEAESIKELAGIQGSKVHQSIEQLLKGDEIRHDSKCLNTQTGQADEITVDEYESIISFRDWYAETKPEVINTEHTILNMELGIAGTLDLFCMIDNEPWIIDFKTSQYVWPANTVQLTGYKMCGFPDTKLGILQLGYRRNKQGWKFTELEYKPELFNAAHEIWKNEHGNEKPRQRDLPVSVRL